MVRILNPQSTKILVASPQGAFDGAVAHLQDRDLFHPLLTAPVAGGPFPTRWMGIGCHSPCSIKRRYHAHTGTPMAGRRNGCSEIQGLSRCGGTVGAHHHALSDALPLGPNFQ